MCVCVCGYVLFQKRNAAEQRERIIIFHAGKKEKRERMRKEARIGGMKKTGGKGALFLDHSGFY